jgi:hypothetical protein
MPVPVAPSQAQEGGGRRLLLPSAAVPRGSYRARVCRSYGKAGRVYIMAGDWCLGSVECGGKGSIIAPVLRHPGGPMTLGFDPGVYASIEIERLNERKTR